MVEGTSRAGGAEHRQRQAYNLPPSQRRAGRNRNSGQCARRNRDADPELQERNRHADCGEHGQFSFRRERRDQRNSQSSDRYFQLMK